MNRIFAVMVAALILTPLAALAENADEGLYDPVPPDGSAFVRFVNIDPAVKDEGPDANGKEYDDVEFGTVSPYYVVPKGELKTTFESATATAPIEEGKFYTQVLSGKEIKTITDSVSNVPAKAQVSLYNLSASSPELSLKTADGKTAITQTPVKPFETATRAMNAVKVGTAVYKGDGKVADVDSLVLERGKAYGVFVMDDGGKAKIVTAQAKTDTKK